MHKLFLLSFVLMLCSFGLSAQDEDVQSVSLSALPDDYATCIFGDKVNVRKIPAASGAVVDQLVAGDAVKVVKAEETKLTLNGWEAAWHKINYTKNGASRTGYIWGALLSPNAPKAGDVTFVYNVTAAKTKMIKDGDSEYPQYQNDIEIRAVRNGSIIHTAKLKLPFDPGYYSCGKVYNNRGLKGVKNVLEFRFSFPACGYTQYEAWYTWNGTTLNPLPVIQFFSDPPVAGGEEYIFPDMEKGKDGQILLHYEETVMDDEGNSNIEQQWTRPLILSGKTYTKPKVKG